MSSRDPFGLLLTSSRSSLCSSTDSWRARQAKNEPIARRPAVTRAIPSVAVSAASGTSGWSREDITPVSRAEGGGGELRLPQQRACARTCPLLPVANATRLSRRADTVGVMTSELSELRRSLLRNLRRDLGPTDGDLAFDCHILLAVRIHRAAGLNQHSSDGEGDGWRRYFVDYFPEGRNSPDDADYLWREWRTRMLKHESPRGITHGQSHGHWCPLPGGGFCVNLESMWDDFEDSVGRFIQALEANAPRGELALKRWRERSWTVRSLPVYPSAHTLPSPTLFPGAVSASVAASATAYVSDDVVGRDRGADSRRPLS
jgi:hypothetical protein